MHRAPHQPDRMPTIEYFCPLESAVSKIFSHIQHIYHLQTQPHTCNPSTSITEPVPCPINDTNRPIESIC